MFGLLQNRTLTPEELSDFRLNYCGTCKTIGKLYGHKERLLLNFDVVFLSELLAAITNRKEDFQYIKPYTCLTLPETEEHIPSFLKYTASINIFLGHYKILDNVNDAKFKFNIWILLQYFTNSNFRKAKRYLTGQGLPADKIDSQIREQFKREKQKISFDNLHDTLKYYSNPTAQITGLAFKHSVSKFNDERLSRAFWEIGTNFGQIVYIIDAIEDYEQDKKNEGFNLFLLHNLTDKSELIDTAKACIYEYLDRIKSAINLLPISESNKKIFVSNLVSNVNRKISPTRCNSTFKNCTTKKLSIKERYQYALTIAKNISQKKKNIFAQYSSHIYLGFSLILLFILFPHLVHAANYSTYKSESDFSHSCCGPICSFCCDGTCNSCCKCGHGSGCDNGHCWKESGETMPCGGCCGCLCFLGVCGSCLPTASEGPKVIIKIIEAPAKGCCDR